jgi:hypothetical protein
VPIAGTTLVLLALANFVPGVATAQSGGPYDLSWSTVDGGGITPASGGSYVLNGTAGQPDAGMSSGGIYVVQGGFWGGASTVTAVDDELPETIALVFRLYAAAPNPFNPRTTIAFDLPQAGPVRLAVYDVRGARVRTLESEVLPAGHHIRTWDGRDDTGAPVASGTYVFSIETADHRARQKGVLIK